MRSYSNKKIRSKTFSAPRKTFSCLVLFVSYFLLFRNYFLFTKKLWKWNLDLKQIDVATLDAPSIDFSLQQRLFHVRDQRPSVSSSFYFDSLPRWNLKLPAQISVALAVSTCLISKRISVSISVTCNFQDKLVTTDKQKNV